MITIGNNKLRAVFKADKRDCTRLRFKIMLDDAVRRTTGGDSAAR